MSTQVVTDTAAPAAARGVTGPGGLEPAGLGPVPFLSIVCLFWLYATVSAVLFAYGLDASFTREVGKSLFASWQARVIQYLVLLPPLLACYWWSLRLGWRPLARRLPVQAGLGLAFAVMARPALWVGVRLLGDEQADDHETWMGMLGWLGPELPGWIASFTDFLVRYGFGLALVTGFAFYKQYRDSEARRGAIEREWSAARLAALRMQLSPHTLFNLLHTIRGQIGWDPPAAQAMVVQLADLLRRLLRAGEREFSRLGEELHFVQLYLELQQRRFAERLSVELPAGEGLPDAWVPSLILQPLVENAVVHGMAGHGAPVHVKVTVAAAGGELHLQVSNTVAPGRTAGPEGIGLRNVRERLAVQFGVGAARLAAGPREPGLWVAEVHMPFLRSMPAGAGSSA